jgi:hypothetical protein
MRDFYSGWELRYYRKVRSLSGFLIETPLKLIRALVFFAGIALLPPLIMFRPVVRDRRIRFLLVCTAILAVGMLLETWLIPHYLSPFASAFYAIGLQAMRHLRLWVPNQQPVGVALVRFIVTLCVGLAALRAFAEPLHLRLAPWPTVTWFGSQDFGIPRANVQNTLEHLSGRQLVIVRYAPGHEPLNEWVYNAADIDGSKVIWAREGDVASDLELIRYYKDRRVWLVEPDKQPALLSPYKMPPGVVAVGQ